MKLREFATCMAVIEATVGKEMTEEQSAAWYELLKDLTRDELERGVRVALQTHTFGGFPPIGKIRECAGVSSRAITSDDKATLAWESVRRAIKKVGSYDSPKFDDPIIHAAIRSIGGWISLCDTPPDEMKWRERDFRTNYASLSKCDLPTEQTQRLFGIAEKENGPAIPVRVAEVGVLTGGGASGVRREIEAPPPKRIAGVVATPIASLSERLGIEYEETTVKAREFAPPVPKDVQLAGLRLLGWKGSES